MTLSALLWDLDGTLIDSEPVHIAALKDVLAQAELPIPPDLHDWLIGLGARQVHQVLVERLGLALSYESLVGHKHEAYRRRCAELRPRSGSLEVFRSLARRGIRQAIVSNSDRVLVDLNLTALGLAVPDQVSISRNDVRCGKPDPEAYLRAAWLLGELSRACVVVEDSPVGAAAGLAAGMRVVVWPQAGQACPAEFPGGVLHVESADALTMLLDRLVHEPIEARACRHP